MFNQKGDRMRKTKIIILTIVASLLSFGMIDSTTTQTEDSNPMGRFGKRRGTQKTKPRNSESNNITRMNLTDS